MEAVSNPAIGWANAVTHEFFGNRSVLPLRGGNWWNTSGAGVFALNLNNPREYSGWNVGFRAALPSQPDIQNLWVLFQCRGDKGTCPLPEMAKIKLHGSRQ